MRRARRPTRPVQIAVAGGGACSRATARLATAVGAEIARAGAVLVCGGRGGVMAAAARGASRGGGVVLGLLPGAVHGGGNPHLSLVVPTGLGHARNVLVAAAGEALIAVAGEHGTLSEVAFAIVLGRPVVALGAWADVPGVLHAGTPAEAVRLAIKHARSRGPRRAAR